MIAIGSLPGEMGRIHVTLSCSPACLFVDRSTRSTRVIEPFFQPLLTLLLKPPLLHPNLPVHSPRLPSHMK